MASYAIESFADSSNHYTHLDLTVPDDLTKPLQLAWRYFNGTQLVDAMTVNLSIPFLVRFRKYDLANNRLYWGYLEYAASGRPRVTLSAAERKLVLEYTATAVRDVYRPPNLDVPAYVEDLPDTTLDPIAVTLTFVAASYAPNYGWINFDLHHTYPAQIPASNAQYGWEQTIHYPYLDFNPSNPATLEPPITGPLNFSAVYRKTSSATAVNTATGLAIHVDDVNGHDTVAWYDPNGHALNYALRNPIHLNGTTFAHAPDYQLSGGDAFGFGGNKMVYRLRAFQASGAAPGAPVGWQDAMEVYRSWLHTRYDSDTSTLFYKNLRPARTKNAPVDQMAPHTVISNYGLDGAVDPTPDAKLCGWLEMHPLLHATPDTPNAQNNLAFAQIANRLQALYPDTAKPKLEVQAWGIEQAGFYQFNCGFPPLTNVLSLSGQQKFLAGVNALAANQNTAISITTDPMSPLFNRGRFGGHIKFIDGGDWKKVQDKSQWQSFITQPFPAKVQAQNCAVTVTKIGGKQYNRVWITEGYPSIEKTPNSPYTDRLKASQRTDEWGQLRQTKPVIASALYRGTQKQICPTADLASIYINNWVKPWLIDQNVRLLEFMKHAPSEYYCYRKDHQHIVKHPHVPDQTDPRYNNVIGHGAWYPRRLRCILFDAHELGKKFDADPFCTFRIIHEFAPKEVLVPYLDEYYTGSETYDYVYSHLVAHHDTPGRGGWGVHPGYQEAPQASGASLDWMLSPDRDTAARPPLHTATNPQPAARTASLNEWRKRCVDHFNTYYKVAEWGTAPRGYPIAAASAGALVPWNPQHPLADTNPRTYTYNRCVQQWFNLRANIFATANSAVTGLRIMIPSSWLEDPRDYDREAVLHAVRATRMQMDCAGFFRRGRMLGETAINAFNNLPLAEIWAWGDGGNPNRTFLDVKPLVDLLTADDAYLGTGWHTLDPRWQLRDFLSKPWDLESYPDGSYNETVVTRQINHRVWQFGDGDTRKVLYAFANAGNTDGTVAFTFSRGLEGITQAAKWRKSVTVYAPAAVAPTTGYAWLGKPDTVVIPARSFAAVVVQK